MPVPEYSLIYWYSDKTSSIISSSKIPLHSRYEQADVKLKWFNAENKKYEYLNAKVVKMSDTYEELNSIDLDDEGNIINDSTQAFSVESQEEATNLKNKRKNIETQQRIVEIKQEKLLSKSNSILNTVDGKKQSIISKPSKNIKVVSEISVPNKINIKKPDIPLPAKSTKVKRHLKTIVDENEPSTSSLKRSKINDNKCLPSTSKSANSSSVLEHRKKIADVTKNHTNIQEPRENSSDTSNTQNKSMKYNDDLCFPSDISDNSEDEIATSDLQNHQTELSVDVKEQIEHKTSSDGKLFFIPNVTSQLITTQKLLLASMIYSYQKTYGHDPETDDDEVTVTNKSQDSDMLQVLKKIKEIEDELFIETSEKDEIFPNSKIYLDKSTLMAVKLSNDTGDCWTKFITDILVQIYGKYLRFMSVKGTRGNKALNKGLQSNLVIIDHSGRSTFAIMDFSSIPTPA